MAIHKPRRAALGETSPAHSWGLDCQCPDCEAIKFGCLNVQPETPGHSSLESTWGSRRGQASVQGAWAQRQGGLLWTFSFCHMPSVLVLTGAVVSSHPGKRAVILPRAPLLGSSLSLTFILPVAQGLSRVDSCLLVTTRIKSCVLSVPRLLLSL